MTKLEHELKQEREKYRKLEKDNESLVESQKFISNYVNSIKDSYGQTISNLQNQLDESNKKNQELEEAFEVQQYLYNKLQSESKNRNTMNAGSRVLSRQNTSPINLDVNKGITFEAVKKLIGTKEFEENVAAVIGIELDESEPERFLDKIIELKKERDAYYVASERAEDLINELKDVLDEENENNLLNCVVKLQNKSCGCNHGKKC